MELIEALKLVVACCFMVAAVYSHKLARYTEGGLRYWYLLAVSAFLLCFNSILGILVITGIFGTELTLYNTVVQLIQLAAAVTFGYAVYGLYKTFSES